MSELALERYVQMPPTLHPTISSLADDGIYLVDACFVIYVYTGRSVSEETVSFRWGRIGPTPVVISVVEVFVLILPE